MAPDHKAAGRIIAGMRHIPLGKVRFTQKKFFWGFIGVAAALFLYAYLLVPIGEAKKKADEEIALKEKVIARYSEILMSRKSLEASLDQTLKRREEVQKRLLPGETPQLGAANLQDIVKRISEKHKINLRSFRTLEVKDAGVYRKISLQIDFNPIRSMDHFLQFIYDLENQEKELIISEMDLIVPNPPFTIHGNLVLSGFMGGSRGEKKGKGKQK